MAQLTDRQTRILHYLLIQETAVTVKELSKQFCLSERMIRYDLLGIEDFVRENKGRMIKKPKVGITVEMDARINLGELNHTSGTLIRVMKADKRRETIQNLLLLSETILTTDDLAKQLSTSRQTITSDLKLLKKSLENTGLAIISKKGEGTCIEGEEEAIRQAIAALLQKQLKKLTIQTLSHSELKAMANDISISRRNAAAYLQEIDLKKLLEAFHYTQEVMNFTILDHDLNQMLLYLIVVIKRSARHPLSIKSRTLSENQREYRAAIILSECLNQSFSLSLGQGEIEQIAVQSISCNMRFLEVREDYLTQQLSPVVDEMIEVLESFPNYALPGLYKDKLKMSLLSHLRLTIKKYNLRLSSSNSLLAAMKVNYPEIFTVVYQMAAVFEKRMNIPLDEDEVGFIAIHIVANVEECSKLRTKKALVVCNTGTGVAKVLENRLSNNIPRLEIIETLASFDLEKNQKALEDADFVISTYELAGLNKPVFLVSPIISPKQIDRISKYINKDHSEQNEIQERNLEALIERYVEPKNHSAFQREIQPFLHKTIQQDELSSEINITFQCSMILAKVSEALVEIEEKFGITIATDRLCGMVIHILMSIPYWHQGSRNKEYGSEEYLQQNIQIYEFICRKLREVTVEYGIEIPEKEAIALMRYFI